MLLEPVVVIPFKLAEVAQRRCNSPPCAIMARSGGTVTEMLAASTPGTALTSARSSSQNAVTADGFGESRASEGNQHDHAIQRRRESGVDGG
jgi:hypothetical protein